ncbi:MAG TPA: PASTA domain-containing protein [Candidatus Acidoferrales bacterium]|nr:PASTA domain-containing protein [Candidatus Acidoferrales bacterium]
MSDDPGRPKRRRPRASDGRRSSRRSWIDYLPIVSLCALAVAVIVVVIAAYEWLSPSGQPVSVPPFIGMPFDQAQTLAASSHVGLRVVAHRVDLHAPKDVIIGQLPSEGEKVREGRVIDVILSDGVPMVSTPNLSNMSLRDAEVALGNAHLSLGKITQVTNLNVVAGVVLEQHPDPFTQVAAGTKVDVAVAQGHPQTYAPSFIGMSIDFAKKAASDGRIALGSITDMPIAAGAKPKGIVVAQDPDAGQALTPGQRISLQVSGGAPATPTPSPTALPTSEASSPLPSPSPSVSPLLPSPGASRVMRISVALPQSDVAQPVRVVLEDATGSQTIYDQTTTGGVTLSFDVTVVGQGTIETYVNDKLVSSTPL